MDVNRRLDIGLTDDISPLFQQLEEMPDYVSDLEGIGEEKDDTVKIKIYEPTLPQVEFKKLEQSGSHLITLLVVGRQVGKSYYALCDSMERALSKGGQRILFVTPTYHLAAKHIFTIEQMFNNNEEHKKMVLKAIKYKAQELVFHNGSMIKFLSAEAEDALRGDTADWIYVDECAFIKETTFNEILMPMVTRTGGRFTLFTTPNGRNWVYKLFEQARKEKNKGNVKALRTDYRSLKDPAVNAIIDQMAKQMTKSQFEREVLAHFVSDAAVFNNINDCILDDWLVPRKVLLEPRYGGLDVGVISDYTVGTIMTHSGWVTDIDRFNMREDELSADEFRDRIREFYHRNDKDNNLVAVYFEINNKELLFEDIEGSVYKEKEQVKWYPINTNGSTKPKMVNALIKVFDEKVPVLPDHDILIPELYAYTSRTNPETGAVKYGNDGEAHDDTVASLVLANYCRIEEGGGGMSLY